MKLNNCKHCSKLIEAKRMGSHVLGCDKNPKFEEYNSKRKETILLKTQKNKSLLKEYHVVCNKCLNGFKVVEDKEKYPQKDKYFCSKQCSNSRKHSAATKEKIANTLFRGEIFTQDEKVLRLKPTNICKKCSCVFTPLINAKYCSSDCDTVTQETRSRISKAVKGKTGGWRNFGGSGKKGYYKEIIYQSSWELAWLIFQYESGFKPERIKDFIVYENEYGVQSKYYPDFYLGTEIFEIKGFWSKKTERKILAAEKIGFKINIIGPNEIQYYLKYCKDKYGNDFWNNPKVFN